MHKGIFLGRQTIVDRAQRVVAYELLFRGSRTSQTAEIDEVGRAVVRVMANTFASLGMDAVLGESLGFFNVNREILLSDVIEALPRERVVIEVLEDVEADEAVIERCRFLQEAGFRIALDDWVVDDPRAPLLPYAEVVKVDLPAIPRRQLRRIVRTLRETSGLLLLAEKVETPTEFERCMNLGFDRFQGYFFARPVVLEGADLDASKKTLIQLLQQISADVESRRIVESFKQDAKLGLNLLRLVNTAGHAARVRLETIEDAVRQLGLERLGRWVSILLYARGDGDDLGSPLLTTAAHRGRLMELVIDRVLDGPIAADREEDGHACSPIGDAGGRRERAFLVGMLSLADALLGRPIGELVQELRLGEDIARALTHHEGPLGELLLFAQSVERCEIEKIEAALPQWSLDMPSLQTLEHEAYAWVHGLIAAPPA